MKILRTISAFLAAGLVPALAFGILGQSVQIIPLAFFIALAHAVILGAPIWYMLQRLKSVHLLSVILVGFIIGGCVVGFLTWPYSPGSRTSGTYNGIQTIVDGIPTIAGWIYYIKSVSVFGAFGVVGAITFWICIRNAPLWSRKSRIYSAGELPAKTTASLVMPILVIGGVASVLLISSYSLDRSCHNPIKGSSTSIGPSASLNLMIEDAEWAELAKQLKHFAAARSLEFRDASETKPDVFRTLYLSICSEVGFTISTAEQRWARRDYEDSMKRSGVGIRVYSWSEKSAWRQPTRELINSLESKWPGQLRFRDSGGRLVSMPESLIEPLTEVR